MILQNPQLPEVYPEGYYMSWDFPLWIAMMALCFIGAFIFFRRFKIAEMFSQKSIFLGTSLLLLFFGITRVCYLIGVWLPVDYNFWTILGYVFQLIAMSALLFEFERSIVKKTKYSLTVFSLFGTVVAIFSLSESINRDITRNLSTIVATADTVLIIVIFIYVILKSTGIIRTRTLISFIGIIMVFVGQIFDTEMIYGIWPTQPLILSPILTDIGLVLLIINWRIHKI